MGHRPQLSTTMTSNRDALLGTVGLALQCSRQVLERMEGDPSADPGPLLDQLADLCRQLSRLEGGTPGPSTPATAPPGAPPRGKARLPHSGEARLVVEPLDVLAEFRDLNVDGVGLRLLQPITVQVGLPNGSLRANRRGTLRWMRGDEVGISFGKDAWLTGRDRLL